MVVAIEGDGALSVVVVVVRLSAVARIVANFSVVAYVLVVGVITVVVVIVSKTNGTIRFPVTGGTMVNVFNSIAGVVDGASLDLVLVLMAVLAWVEVLAVGGSLMNEKIPLLFITPRPDTLIGSWAIDISCGRFTFLPCSITLDIVWNVSSLY